MGEAQTSGEHQASPNLQTACPRGSGNNDKALASVSPKPGCTPGSCVRCWLRLQRSVLSFCFSNSCLHQHHPATCSFVVTLVLLAWHSQGCIHMFIQGGNTGTGEDSGCFSTSDTNSRNWGNFPPSLLNQCRGSAITPTVLSLKPPPGLETGIATTPKPPGTASARGTDQQRGCRDTPHGFRAVPAQMVWDGLSPQPCHGYSQKSQDFTACS